MKALFQTAIPVAFAGLLLSAPSFASDTSYPYLGGKLGYSKFNDPCGDMYDSCDDDDLGMGVYGGYRFNDWFGLEGSYLYSGEATTNGSIDTDYNLFEISPMLYAQFAERWQGFAKVGPAYWDGETSGAGSKVSDDGWTWTAGLGVIYSLARNWDLRLEYQYYDDLGDGDKLIDTDLHFTSLGLNYKFGVAAAPVPTPAPEPEQMPEPAPEPEQMPEPEPVMIESVRARVEFAFDSSELTQADKLDAIIAHMKQYPDTSVLISGFTDSVGSDEYNQALSERRSESVASYLETQDIARERMIIEEFGEDHPEFSNETAEGRAHNRRVLLYIQAFEQ
ncbi:OmpA family protein [Aliagarivorans marinus]|uniref:OmpA family protein n=1 Tax=Aliagarivorans marinus TaxID=561965 RepID=UPI000425AF83|nr:OmpA family protein [Aliagarivorans marinus]